MATNIQRRTERAPITLEQRIDTNIQRRTERAASTPEQRIATNCHRRTVRPATTHEQRVAANSHRQALYRRKLITEARSSTHSSHADNVATDAANFKQAIDTTMVFYTCAQSQLSTELNKWTKKI